MLETPRVFERQPFQETCARFSKFSGCSWIRLGLAPPMVEAFSWSTMVGKILTRDLRIRRRMHIWTHLLHIQRIMNMKNAWIICLCRVARSQSMVLILSAVLQWYV